jgi:hypothetical protein
MRACSVCVPLFTVLLRVILPTRFAAAREPATAIRVEATKVQRINIVRETAVFTDWNPYEAVSPFVQRKPNATKLPRVIFVPGMGANKPR